MKSVFFFWFVIVGIANAAWSPTVTLFNADGENKAYDLTAATDRHGERVFAWAEKSGKEYRIWAMRQSEQGGHGPVLIGRGRFRIDDGIQVKLDSKGNAYLLWLQPDRYEIPTLWFAREDKGGKWTEPVALNDKNSAPELYQPPTITFNRQGDTLIVWESGPFGNKEIWSILYDAKGKSWLQPTKRASGVRLLNQEKTGVIFDDNGDFSLVWLQLRPAEWTGSKKEMFGGQIWTASCAGKAGGGCEARSLVDEKEDELNAPAFAVNGKGDAVLVFRNGRTKEIFASVRRSGKRSWPAPELLEDGKNVPGGANDPVAVIDEDGRITAAWTNVPHPKGNLLAESWSRLYTPTSGWEERKPLYLDEVAHVSVRQLVINGSGEIAAIGGLYEDKYEPLYMNNVWISTGKASEKWSAAELLVEPSSPGARILRARAGIDDNGDQFVAWIDGSTLKVHARFFKREEKR